MGLDMYLTRKMYVKNWDYEGADRTEGSITVNGKQVDITNLKYLEFESGYWRKANAIHRWFVRNVQGGRDDCGDYYVSEDDMKELLDLCKYVMEVAEIQNDCDVKNGTTYKADGTVVQHTQKGRVALNPEELSKILPTEKGFFFGTYDYDEWYLQDIEYTIKLLTDILSSDDEGDYYYHASW